MTSPTTPAVARSPELADSMSSGRELAANLLRKVPEITIFFWIIKILCATVGETAAGPGQGDAGPTAGRTVGPAGRISGTAGTRSST